MAASAEVVYGAGGLGPSEVSRLEMPQSMLPARSSSVRLVMLSMRVAIALPPSTPMALSCSQSEATEHRGWERLDTRRSTYS